MSGGVPAGWVLVPKVATETMERAALEKVGPYHDLGDEWQTVMPGDLFRLAWPAMLAATPTPPIEGRDADVERDVRVILQAVADADSEDCIGSIDVDIPKGGYPRQWLREAARAALQALGERG